jgi:hypothetical protein
VEAPGRVELPTNGLGNRCSIHLSYGACEAIHYLTLIFRADVAARQRKFASPTALSMVTATASISAAWGRHRVEGKIEFQYIHPWFANAVCRIPMQSV